METVECVVEYDYNKEQPDELNIRYSNNFGTISTGRNANRYSTPKDGGKFYK